MSIERGFGRIFVGKRYCEPGSKGRDNKKNVRLPTGSLVERAVFGWVLFCRDDVVNRGVHVGAEFHGS